jgi:hypothetical protein
VILFTAERSQSFSIKQIHNPGHNLKCSAVKKKIQRLNSKQIHNPGHNLKGSAATDDLKG